MTDTNWLDRFERKHPTLTGLFAWTIALFVGLPLLVFACFLFAYYITCAVCWGLILVGVL